MAFDQKGLDDYVDVAQRIADFREQYPGGSLQPLEPAHPFDIRELTGTDKNGKQFTATMIVYVAAAYRDRDDPRPGVGCAWEPFPGRTPYTLGSELMNAETSAWGRAIIAVLASDSKRGVASREEVRNRSSERDESAPIRPLDELPRNRDGSLSRRGCTQAELAHYGAMNSEQKEQHNKLERDVLGTDSKGKVKHPVGERLATTPEDDPWRDAPAGELPPLRTPHAAPPKAGVIHQYFNRLLDINPGHETTEQRLERIGFLGAIIHRKITSTNDLTAAEGIEAAKFLGGCKNKDALIEKLALRDVAAGHMPVPPAATTTNPTDTKED